VEGDVLGAITLFLKGGLPWLAADCVNNNSSYVLKVYNFKKKGSCLLTKNQFHQFLSCYTNKEDRINDFQDTFKKIDIKHQSI
jgi:hypothetical protein